jgi:hypothetical protein
MLFAPLMGLELLGLVKPVTGLPDWDTGLIPWSKEPAPRLAVCGLLREVPGLGTEAMAFSSINISATPSSSSSISSMNFSFTTALHFKSHAAYSITTQNDKNISNF